MHTFLVQLLFYALRLQYVYVVIELYQIKNLKRTRYISFTNKKYLAWQRAIYGNC